MSSTFLLSGIPVLEQMHTWISIPICVMYIVALVGNLFLIFLTVIEQHLHEPMYYFLAMLVATDVNLSLSFMSTMISVHWLSWCSVTLDVCVTEMFFIHTFGGGKSGVLVAMAFDHFMAIRFPLHYATILTHGVIGRIGAAVLLWSVGTVLPVPFLIKRLLSATPTPSPTHSASIRMP